MKLANITKTFGTIVAVDDVSLFIAPGTIVGLIGENGAGKTTLMRILAAEGRIVSLISHKLREVLSVASRTVVMRHGRNVADGSGMTAEELAKAMVGDVVWARASARASGLKPASTLLSIQNLTVAGGE